VEERGSKSLSNVDVNNIDDYDSFKDFPVERNEFSSLPYEEYVNMNNANDRPTVDDVDYPKNRQSIGELVRRLNCSASKKYEDVDQDFDVVGKTGDKNNTIYATSNDSHSETGSREWRMNASSDIVRPVLITIKDRDTNEIAPSSDHDSKYPNQPTDVNSSFMVGEIPTSFKVSSSPTFRLGMSARKRNHNAVKYFKNHSARNNERTLSCSRWRNNNVPDHRDTDGVRTAQEAARRERWKRGLEMEHRMFKNSITATIRSRRDRDDNSSTDSLTQGSHTTGTSNTDYDTTGDLSSVDDWTESTDESHLAPKYHDRYRRNPFTGPCTQQVVENVVEDFAIFGKLLLSDGYACFGTAAAITKETVTGCKGEKI